MNFTASRFFRRFFGILAVLTVLTVGAALAEDTYLSVSLKGITPAGVDSWRSISLSGRFDVLADGTKIGQVSAKSEEAIEVPSGANVTLMPVADDFADGFVCEGPIAVTLEDGVVNTVNVFAYAKRGILSVTNVSSDGGALGSAEFMVLDAQGNLQFSFATDEQGRYTAQQALENGTYSLVQMRSAEGTLPLTEAVPFEATTYFGTAESLTNVTVTNAPVPAWNASAATVSLANGALSYEDLSAQVSIVLSGTNDLPLQAPVLSLQPAQLLDRDGNVLSCAQAVRIDSLSYAGEYTLRIKATHADGTTEDAVLTPDDSVALTDAVSAEIAFENAQGEATLPVEFQAGTLTAVLRYEPVTFLPTEPSAALSRTEVSFAYSYRYADTDGVGVVTAQSEVPAVSLDIEIPDGKQTVDVQAAAQDGKLVLSAVQPVAEALDLVVVPNNGVRFDAASLPNGVKLLRLEQEDWLLLSSENLTAEIAVAGGTLNTVVIWARDPQTLPVTVDNPQGSLLTAETYESNLLADAVFGVHNGAYAQLSTGESVEHITVDGGATLTTLAKGTVVEAADGAASASNLPVLLTNGSVCYGALTDANGAFEILGDADVNTAALTVLLPENAALTGDTSADTALSLPNENVAVTFRRMSGIGGTVATADGKPLAGVTVTVGDASTETNALGAYRFDALDAGDYTLTATIADGVNARFESGSRTESASLTLTYGGSAEQRFTVVELCALQGSIALDDAPVAEQTVTLTNAANESQTAATDAEGQFAFSGLESGAYRLAFETGDNRAVVSLNGQTDVQVGAFAADFSLEAGKTASAELVMQETASIVGQVSSLGEGNTIAAASVSEQLSAATDANGAFRFDGLIAGAYTVYAPLTAGKTLTEGALWQVTQQGDMIWLTVNIEAGNVYELPAVEYVAMTSVSGVAYMDDNGDLTRSDGEQLMSGVPVALQQETDGVWTDVEDAKTDEFGAYSFQNLTAGTYRVVSKASEGVYVSAVGAKANDVGDASLGVKASEALALANGDMLSGVADVALSQPSALRIAAFADSNENGVRGEYERAITGVTVELLSADGETVLASAITDATGEASIGAITPSTYVLRFTMPDNYLYTVASGELGIDSGVAASDDSVALSEPIAFAAGQTVECGVGAIPVGSFSGRVWNDQNNNGVMDADEPGVANVTLTLTGVKTGASYQLTTDETGEYRFARLRNDTYNFTANAPDGMLFARYTQTGGDSRSVFTTEGSSSSRQFIVSGAEDVSNKNVGLIDKATIHGFAFLDLNYNGVFDEGEPLYAGVTVEVIKNTSNKSMGKVVTAEDGTYEIGGLRGGDYRLRAILPNDGSVFTVVPESADGLSNQFVAREGRRENSIASLNVNNGETVETCVGVAMGATVSGTVFRDSAYDGVMSGDDKAWNGVKVRLVDESGAVVATATTNAKGNYTLEDIIPGVYTVQFLRKDENAFTRYRPNEAGGSHVLSMNKDGYGCTEALNIAMGQTVVDINAGMLPSSTVTGVLFDDANDNGLRDETEQGYTAAQVRLLSEDGEIDLTESVTEDGTYFFDGVMPGAYTVTFLLPEHATIAKTAEGGNTLVADGRETVLSGLTVEMGKAYSAPLVGALTLGSFEGYAYHDANGNGVKDEGEEAMQGVAVTLAGAANEAQSVVTDADGRYVITELRPDTYSLTIALPQGYILSANVGGLTMDTLTETTVACPWSELTDRGAKTIGAVKPATVTAYVWLDEDKNGVQADGEQLMTGLRFELYDEVLAKVVKSASSDESGYVTFANVRPSTYSVRFDMPTQAEAAADTASTFSEQNGRMVHSGIVIAEGAAFDAVHCGVVSRTSIGGTLSLDENGLRTALSGVTVELLDENGQSLQTTMTDEKGMYRFNGLWPAGYTLRVQQPEGVLFVRSDDAAYEGVSCVRSSEGDWGTSEPIALRMAQHQLQCNVIYIKTAKIGDMAWLDSNGNGLVDEGEPTLSGVTVNLTQNGEIKYTTVTNEWGYYELSGVYPGSYVLQAVAYPQLTIAPSVPALRIISSCLTAGDGDSAAADEFTIASGVSDFNFDLGYCLKEGESLPDGATVSPVQDWTVTYGTPAEE